MKKNKQETKSQKILADFIEKYKTQDELVDFEILNKLDDRIVYSMYKAMLESTLQDCIDLEYGYDYINPLTIYEDPSIVGNIKLGNRFVTKIADVEPKTIIDISSIAIDELENLIEYLLFQNDLAKAFSKDIPYLDDEVIIYLSAEDIACDVVDYLIQQPEANFETICDTIMRYISLYIVNREISDEIIINDEEFEKDRDEFIKKYNINEKDYEYDIEFEDTEDGGTDE